MLNMFLWLIAKDCRGYGPKPRNAPDGLNGEDQSHNAKHVTQQMQSSGGLFTYRTSSSGTLQSRISASVAEPTIRWRRGEWR